MKATLSVIAAILLATAAVANGEPVQPCRFDPKVVGACFSVHGRLRFGNGNPSLRMWRVGTSRYLGIIDDEDPIIPANVADCLAPKDAEQGFDVEVFGDFVVCPFTEPHPGAMQMVCVDSATHMIAQRLHEAARPCAPAPRATAPFVSPS